MLAVCFLQAGKQRISTHSNLFLVGEEQDSSVNVSVWDIESKSKLACGPVDTKQLCSLSFNPCVRDVFVTLGITMLYTLYLHIILHLLYLLAIVYLLYILTIIVYLLYILTIVYLLYILIIV